MSIGFWQIILLLFVVLILFGAGKIPRVMGDLGKGIRHFKKGISDDSDDEKEIKEVKKISKSTPKKTKSKSAKK